MFLTELFGNPNKQNSQNETALHLACQLPVNASPAVQDRKVACVQLILQWKGCFPSLVGGIELVDIKVQDLVSHGYIKYLTIFLLSLLISFFRMVTPLFTQLQVQVWNMLLSF